MHDAGYNQSQKNNTENCNRERKNLHQSRCRRNIAESNQKCSNDSPINSVDVGGLFNFAEYQSGDADCEDENERLEHEFSLDLMETTCFCLSRDWQGSTLFTLTVEKCQIEGEEENNDEGNYHATDTHLSTLDTLSRTIIIPKSPASR